MTGPNTLFTRSQLEAVTGLDGQSIDYWTRNGILRPVSGGGGKGQHRKYDALQATLAAVLSQLQRLGMNGRGLQQVASEFPPAIEFYRSIGPIEDEAIIGSLMEYRLDVATDGYALVSDSDDLARLGVGTEFVDPHRPNARKRKLDWLGVVAYHRIGSERDKVTAEVVAQCEAIDPANFDKFHKRYLVVSPTKNSVKTVPEVCLTRDDDDGWSMFFEEQPADALSYVKINLALLKQALWGWK